MVRAVRPVSAILVDVAAGDQRRRRNAPSQCQQRAARRRIDKAAGHRGLVGRLVEQRLVQEQRELARAQARGGLDDRVLLIGGHRKIAAQQLRVDGEQAPARHVERPPVGAEMRDVAGAPLIGDHGLTMRGAILAVAEIVVAGQEAHGQADRVVQRARRREVALLGRAVERDIARVQHQVGPARRATPRRCARNCRRRTASRR